MRGPTVPWKPAEDEEIKRLAGQGLSANQIAGHIPGRSRNAVIGRLNRLGLVLSKLQGSTAGRMIPRKKKAKAAPRPRVVYPKPTVVEGVPLPPSEYIFAEEITASPVKLMDLTDDTCKWPVGELYCGAMALHGKPYCAKHNAAAHQPASPRRPGGIRWKTW